MERQQRSILMCTNTPVSDLTIEARVAAGAGDIVEQNFRVKVRRIERVSDELLILHVRMGRGQRMRFLAGQYATLRLPGAGEFDFSIASCPCDEKHLEFHVRRVEDEPVSEYIFAAMRQRERLELAGPKGKFVFEETSDRPIIMIAFDTGFAAIKSLLEHATAQEKERRIFLYWIACGKEGQYLRNLCRAWRDALDDFHYVPLSISESLKEIMAQRVRGCEITKQKLLQVVQQHPDLSGFDVYIAAPPAFLDSAREIFLAHRLELSHYKAEIVHGNQNVSCLADAVSKASE
jgi:CDP-4-dehydro-6-deoxyglucose reductase